MSRLLLLIKDGDEKGFDDLAWGIEHVEDEEG